MGATNNTAGMKEEMAVALLMGEKISQTEFALKYNVSRQYAHIVYDELTAETSNKSGIENRMEKVKSDFRIMIYIACEKFRNDPSFILKIKQFWKTYLYIYDLTPNSHEAIRMAKNMWKIAQPDLRIKDFYIKLNR